jgi:ABC-2 type transport system ATP-binding protein
MKQDGHTVLLTTHYIEEAEALCDRIAIIDRGGIIATGSPRELIARSSAMQSVSVRATAALDPALLGRLPAAEDVTCDGPTARLRTSDVQRTLAALMTLLTEQHIELVELHVQKASLEDVFLQLTGAGIRE